MAWGVSFKDVVAVLAVQQQATDPENYRELPNRASAACELGFYNPADHGAAPPLLLPLARQQELSSIHQLDALISSRYNCTNSNNSPSRVNAHAPSAMGPC